MAGWAHLRLMTSSHENRRHHRRQTTSPKPHRQDREDAPPVRLPHVVVTVDEPGTLRVTVDGIDLPAPEDEQSWTRARFADMLDLVTDDRRVAVRVEVHESDGSTFTQQRVKSYAELLKTPRALNPVVEELGDDTTASDLAGQITVTTPPETVIVEVAVTNPDPEHAQEIATAIGTTFPEVVSEVERPEGSKKTSPIKVSLVEPASTSKTPTSPVPTRNLALGLVLGLLLGAGLAMLRHLLDTTVRTDEDVEEITEEPDYDAAVAAVS